MNVKVTQLLAIEEFVWRRLVNRDGLYRGNCYGCGREVAGQLRWLQLLRNCRKNQKGAEEESSADLQGFHEALNITNGRVQETPVNTAETPVLATYPIDLGEAAKADGLPLLSPPAPHQSPLNGD